VTATLMQNLMIWGGASDASFAGEVLVKGHRIRYVAHGANQMACGRALDVVKGRGKTLMVEGHRGLAFVGLARDQDLGDIPPEEHRLRAGRNANLILNHGQGGPSGRPTPSACLLGHEGRPEAWRST
jgi:hypothetical protein